MVFLTILRHLAQKFETFGIGTKAKKLTQSRPKGLKITGPFLQDIFWVKLECSHASVFKQTLIFVILLSSCLALIKRQTKPLLKTRKWFQSRVLLTKQTNRDSNPGLVRRLSALTYTPSHCIILPYLVSKC